MAAIDILIAKSCIRAPGNGATAVSVTDGDVHALGTLQGGYIYELRILPNTEGDVVCCHYRSDGVTPDANDAPCMGSDGGHIIIPAGATGVSVIRDATYTDNFTAWLTPMDGGSIT
jgi:hypothetical protein